MAWNAIDGDALRAQSALTFTHRGICPFLLAVLVVTPRIRSCGFLRAAFHFGVLLL